MTRSFNFCSGPAALPEEVLKQAQEELLDWRGKGLSVMEMSHRSPEFTSIARQAEDDLRTLMRIPDNYEILFVQGGATAQFSAVPLNLFGKNATADFVLTGAWSKKAVAEAARYGSVRVAASSESDNFLSIPPQEEWQLDSRAAYVHYTPNETIGGVEFNFVPSVGDVPLVADMSSSILSQVIDINDFGLIYAGAQKNIGPSGITIVIVREDLLSQAMPSCPTSMSYQTASKHRSLYNTPPSFAWYLSGLVFKWLLRQGGVEVMEKTNARKAAKLYGYIDGSAFYQAPVTVAARSRMNVPFRLVNDQLDSVFLEKAEANGLLNLQGHRSVGGMRASIYNAVPEAAVDALINFMSDFEKQHA